MVLCRRWPRSLRKDNVSAPNTPRDSHAMGTKKYLAPREEYFFLFRDSASAATNPGPLSAVERYDGAKVSLHVASHTRSFPSFQGTIEIPSGLLPSDLATPEGSKRAGIILWFTLQGSFCHYKFNTHNHYNFQLFHNQFRT